MAHFAELDENNIVINVISCGNEFENTGESINQEITGNVWKRTSYNTSNGIHTNGGEPFRYNFAGIGYTFDPTKGSDGAFIPTKPFESWTLNEETCTWQPPYPCPDSLAYFWDEDTTSWVELVPPTE